MVTTVDLTTYTIERCNETKRQKKTCIWSHIQHNIRTLQLELPWIIMWSRDIYICTQQANDINTLYSVYNTILWRHNKRHVQKRLAMRSTFRFQVHRFRIYYFRTLASGSASDAVYAIRVTPPPVNPCIQLQASVFSITWRRAHDVASASSTRCFAASKHCKYKL